MEKYIGIAIEKIEKSNNFRRFQAQLIHIAAQLCVLGKYIEANRYLQIFDKRELKNFNNKVINCYKFTEDMLKLHGYT